MSENNDSFVRITELIGEMSWGIGAPSPIVLHYCDIDGEVKTKAMPPQSMEPVFEAIYQKLKESPNYNPLTTLRKEVAALEGRIALLENVCEEAQAVRQSLVSYPDFLTLHITLPKLETALRAAGYEVGV